MEPPPRLEFSNSSGGWLDCSASGSPQPSIDWLSVDGTSVGDVSGIRRVLRNGTLFLMPFPAASYRQDIHSTVYRCVASNAVGRIISRDVQVRAVVTQSFKVDVEVIAAARGCTAVLRCVVPNFVKDLVRIISWVQEPSFFIYPSLQGDGKFHQLPSGELLIHNLEFSDQFPTYRCRTMHRLSRQVVVSSAANVRITEHRGIVTPVIVESSGTVTVAQDEGAALICIAQGCPSPEYRWYNHGSMEPSLIMPGPRTRQLGPVLAIEAVTAEDGGTYRCSASNAGGEASSDIRLIVSTPLHVEISPPLLSVHMGGSAEFRCVVSTQSGGPHLITWYKDGRQLPSTGRGPSESLIVNNVGREDRGMYQCVVRRAEGDTAQASSELQLGDAPPVLLYSFIEQTLQPGPAVSLKCSASGNPTPQISWLLDGFPLPSHGRFVIGQYVTVHGDVISHVNISHVMVEDGGEYTCTAENRAGKSSHSARLNVYGMPYIRLIPKVTAVAGEQLKLKCPVAGYPIEEIHWERSGSELPNGLRQKVLPDGTLIIEPVQKKEDSGVYTCWARNKQGHSARRSGEVNVIVPPRWLVEPADVSVERNRHVALHCQAQGVPTPTVIWKKATGSKSGDYEEVRDHMYTKLLGNGTLLLQHVKEDREGYYLCQADNGIGTGIGKVIQLRVNSSPYFSAPSRMVTVKKGDAAILHCDVNGDKPISVIWLRGGKIELNPSTNYRVNAKQDVTPDGVAAELQILNADASDSGAYFCQASNMYGRDQQLVQLLVQEPPMPPQNLEVPSKSSTSVNLKWAHKAGDSNEVFKFIVEFKEMERSWHQIDLTETPLPYSAIIDDLKPSTKYTFRIIAEGPAGRSVPSDEILVKTLSEKPAGPPLNPNARPISSTEVLVTWTPPLPELRHGEIQGFNVGYRSASMGSYNFTSVTGDGEDGGEILLGGLAKFTRYHIVIQAYNEVGAGPLSDPVTAQTMEDVPSRPPMDVRCAPLTSQSLQVSWQPPPTEDCNGLLQGYKLTYEPVPDDRWRGNDEMETRKTTALTTVITGLRKFTNYSLQVLAFTKVGDGVLTVPHYCQTEEDVPGSPADIKVVVATPQSLKVSWLAPLEPNGIVTKYNLYRRAPDGRQEAENGRQIISSHNTVFEVKNVQQHLEYQFWVTASTRIGEGQSSKVVTQVITSRIPARIISFGGLVVRPWRTTVSFSCESVGSPRREWLRSDQILKGGANHNQQLLDTGELILSSLQITDAGNYTCQVDNGHGTDRITYNLVVQVPPSAPLLYVTSATSSSILLHWKPGNNGGAAISGFHLNYRKEHGDLDEVHLSRHATSFELKGLLCGSTYHLYLTAHNKIGPSPPSHPLQARTQGHPPGVPPALSFISPNSTSVTLRLHVWPDNGCPILYFVLQYRKATDSQWTLVSNALKPQRRTSITGLTTATKYVVKLEAHNVAGFSTEEFSFMTLTKDGDVPPPDLIRQGNDDKPFYSDWKVLIPFIIVVGLAKVLLIGIAVCIRRRRKENAREHLTISRTLRQQRERYYATIHKVALQAGEKIPETSEDISPYATFQLSEPSTLPQNTMLHSFMYHEHPVTEGCASPPPSSSVQRNSPYYNIKQTKKRTESPYYNIQKFQSTKGHGRRRANRKDIDSDESESDQEALTSSRTESSNQLDMKHKAPAFTYHGTAQSSTSSDLSPMSEQKSLPRRNRNSLYRFGAQGRSGSQRHILSHLSVAETVFSESATTTPPGQGGGQIELSEAECDIDTLKKLKLGLRSSLWARPQAGGQQGGGGGQQPPSDYSIAV
ncbi:Down syndrome cell adhesion molecule-like protein Dscam2 isoform X3 [Sitophilus oryzae]|uniref:Down syndrome cell adhesion molecule-like protein Dscam2 isoform X3 n=1 Tax=Sitophilus oryzae TaxID=7048 RepID=A0A6J2Y1J3_SITOR|nr:Down syndrome cell adhesion molecule-like protein Dscam2 isoform X3 [Sitophilus oryzae]